MKKTLRMIAAGAILAGTIFTGAIMSGGASQAANKPKIGAAVYGLNAEFMQIWAAALKQHPAVKSGKVDLTVFDGRYDALVQQEQFETMITQQFNAIIFVPIDVEAGATAVQAAHDAGIPVVGSNTRVNSKLLSAYVGSDDVQSGYMEAKYVLDKIGCKGNVVIIEGPIGQSAQISRLEGNKKALAECPDVKILEQQTANWSRAEAQTLMENWLTAHPNQINGVIGQNDEMALGAIEAIKAAGLKVEDFTIAGIDGITDALNAVKRNDMASILQDARAQAQGALDLAIVKAIGDSYKPMSDIWVTYTDMPWNGGKDAEYNVPWTPVTLGNVDALLDARK
jgi:putative xylitol transport system substrate-binding protein